MKTKKLLVLAVGLALISAAPAQAQTQGYEQQIEAIAQSLSASAVKAERKKLSVLDLTDLQGKSSELGRFLAEELSVALVMGRKDFSVLDRANLKNILAEHKLTAEGLVNPENAKKLGQFAGVDAIVLGTITPLKDDVIVTVKIIATDTAEIVGAARGKMGRTGEIQQLMEHAAAEAVAQAALPPPPKPEDARDFDAPSAKSAFDDLAVELTSFRFTTRKTIMAVLKFTNPSKARTVGVCLNYKGWTPGGQVATTLTDENGEILPLTSHTGINSPIAGNGPDQYKIMQDYFNSGKSGVRSLQQAVNDVTLIRPEQSAIVTAEFELNSGRLGTVFRLQSEVVTLLISHGQLEMLKLNNVFIDGIRPKS